MFLCGDDQHEPPADTRDWPKPWWMRCDTCGTVRPYNDGIYQRAVAGGPHVCVRCPKQTGQLQLDL